MIEECLVVEFGVTGDDCPLAVATAAADATVDCRPPQRRADGNVLLRFSAGEAADALARALDADDRIRYLHVSRSDGRANFRCLSTDPCVVHRLTDAGFLADLLRYEDGRETYTGAVVGHEVLEGVLEAAGEAVGVSLQRIHPLGEEDDDAVARRWDLTPAQEAALRAALRMGYFEVPKEATAAEVAEELGIGKTAFLERLRRGQASLFEQVFG
jgi:predicted DNA binding protein